MEEIQETRMQKCRRKKKENVIKWQKHLEEERIRDKKRRLEKKKELLNSKLKLKQKRLRDAERQRKCRQKKKQLGTAQSTPSTSTIGSYMSQRSFGKAVTKTRKALPESPRKKAAIIMKLAMECVPDKVKRSSSSLSKSSDEELANSKEKIRLTVEEFLNRDDVSRQTAGKREVKSVKNCITGKRENIQKRYMIMTIGEAYHIFKECHPDITIKTSKFYELRPKYIFCVSDTPHNVCVCQYHANMDYLIQSIHQVQSLFPSKCRELLQNMVCDPSDENCMTGNCHVCSVRSVRSLLPIEYDCTEAVKWNQWKDVNGRPSIVVVESTLENAIKEIDARLPQFKIHCFVKDVQSSLLEDKKRNSGDKAVLQVDFAENFSLIPQDEIQSSHWNHNQVTLFTACAWISGETMCFAIISDDLTHNKFVVWVFLKTIITFLKQRFPQLSSLTIFSDGCAAQFKNRYTLSNLCFFQKDFGLRVEWNFFATSHGKGAVDGVGAVIKRRVWMEIKARRFIVTSAKEFYDCAVAVVKGINCMFVPQADIAEYTDWLNDRWQNVSHIPHVQSKHHFKAEDEHSILAARTAVSGLEKVEILSRSHSDTSTVHDINQGCDLPVVGDFVSVSLHVEAGKKEITKEYYAEIISFDTDKDEVGLKFMKSSGTFYIWPDIDDVSYESVSVIKKIVPPPVLKNNRGHFVFT